MTFGSPVALVILFSLIALCAVFFALPALKSPLPGLESKRCADCNKLNKYDRESCEHCGGPLKKVEDDLQEEDQEDKS